MTSSSTKAPYVVRSAASRSDWRKFLNPIKTVQRLLEQRSLIYQLTKREILLRYRGSVLGIFWSFLNPLISLSIYTLVFGYIFNSQFRSGGGEADFALGVFCGLILFNLVAETLTASPRLILQNPNYVTKVVFPLEIFPVVTVLNSLAHLIVALIPLLIGLLIFKQSVPWTWIYLLPVILPLGMLVLGISWFISSLGVFLRDINGVVIPLTQLLLYGSAVFYSIEKVPETLRWLIVLNPLAHFVTQGRDILLFGLPLDFTVMAVLFVISFVVCQAGYIFFMSTKHAFPDVL